MISIVNYYWPKEVLTNFAVRAGFDVDRLVEETAGGVEIAQCSGELDPIYAEIPFFLVMRLVKRLKKAKELASGREASHMSQEKKTQVTGGMAVPGN